MKYLSFQDARDFVRSLGLDSREDWKLYAKSGNKPDDIPVAPEIVYKHDGWKGVGDWLGTERVATHNREYLLFEDARKFVRGLGLKNQNDWKRYTKSGKKPDDIPSFPPRPYRNMSPIK